MKLKKIFATVLFASAMVAAVTGNAHAAPAADNTSASVVQPAEMSAVNSQLQFVALTPEQKAYCLNITTSGLIGMGVGLVGGFFLGSAIGAFPAAIVGGLVGGASGSSAPMPDSEPGKPPLATCSGF